MGRDRMLQTIKAVFTDRKPRVLYECRRCGRSLDAEDDTCPACGSTEVAEFEL